MRPVGAGFTMGHHAESEPYMSKSLEEVRRDLAWMREQLDLRLRRIRNDVGHRFQPLSADAGERAQETENDEVLQRLEQGTTDLIGQYQHAIERIDQGRYGICEDCELPIETERLEALPQATRCKECAGAVRSRLN
jgi:DnaK suppressor protein